MSAHVFQDFPQLVAALGEPPARCDLGPGQAQLAERAALASLDDETLFAGARVRDRALAKCCHSGLWLLYDFLDQSHELSQEIATTEGSYWHGIMHRREPDYANAKYWFRRVPQHPVYDMLKAESQQLASRHELDPPAQFLAASDPWDPNALVDLCEAVARGRSHCRALAEEVAMCEWRLLFAYCYAGAIGR